MFDGLDFSWPNNETVKICVVINYLIQKFKELKTSFGSLSFEEAEYMLQKTKLIKNNINEIEQNLQYISLGDAVEKLINILASIPEEWTDFVEEFIITLKLMTPTAILSHFLHPKYLTSVADLPSSLQSFKVFYDNKKFESIEHESKRVPGLSDGLGHYLGRSENVFSKYNYEEENAIEFWKKPNVVGKYPILASYGQCLANIPAEGPNFDVLDVVSENRHLSDANTLNLYKILKIHNI